jgi:hypothetical protein
MKGTVTAQPTRNGQTRTIRIERCTIARLDPIRENAFGAAASFATICANIDFP